MHSKANQRRQWHPTPVLLPGKSHGRRSLVGCSPWGLEESDTTEWLHFHISLSCIGEGNGNPPQYSCLENPKDGGAWWAAVYGVAQSRTRLKKLSSSSKGQHRIWNLGDSHWMKVADSTLLPSILILLEGLFWLFCALRKDLNIPTWFLSPSVVGSLPPPAASLWPLICTLSVLAAITWFVISNGQSSVLLLCFLTYHFLS